MRSNKNVLILSPYSEHSDLICRSLSKIETIDAKAISTIHEIATYSDELYRAGSSIDLILIDLDLGIEIARNSIVMVRQNNPSAQIVVISKNEPPEEIESLRPWNLLWKPFVESDLLETIKSTLNQKRVSVIEGKFLEEGNIRYPLWARNKGKLIHIMKDALVTLDAQEAILISEEEVIASTGILQENEMASCTKILKKYMDFSGHGELIKQVKLEDNGYLLHAVVLTVGIIIALIFDPDTSYDLIRGQTRSLAGKITHPALPKDESKGDLRQISNKRTGNTGYTKESVNGKIFSKSNDFSQLGSSTKLADPGLMGEQAPYLRSTNYHSLDKNENSNNPSIVAEPDERKNRNSIISVGLSQLPFTCLLIPRLAPKSIPDDLVAFLEERTPQIFISYGWRLNDILIRKDMMQWIASIPPIIAPAYQIKIIRKETSKLIFENFPNINMNGMMKDFWVPGYLVAIGSEKISETEKKELIENHQQRYKLDGPNNFSSSAQNVIYNNY